MPCFSTTAQGAALGAVMACHLPPVEVFRRGPGRSPRWPHVNAAVNVRGQSVQTCAQTYAQTCGASPRARAAHVSRSSTVAGVERGAPAPVDNRASCLASRQRPRAAHGAALGLSPSTCRGLPLWPWAIAAMATCQRSCQREGSKRTNVRPNVRANVRGFAAGQGGPRVEVFHCGRRRARRPGAGRSVEVFRCGPGRSPRWSHVNAAVRAGQRPGCMPSMSAGRSMAGHHALRLDNGPGRGDGPVTFHLSRSSDKHSHCANPGRVLLGGERPRFGRPITEHLHKCLIFEGSGKGQGGRGAGSQKTETYSGSLEFTKT